jgi:hypothetical protein
MGQETENDRNWWKCRFWHGTGNRKRQRLMEICENLHFHQFLSFSVSCPMPKPTCPSVSVVFCFLSHAKTYISISLCRFLFTDGNVGFGMGQETENDRDWWTCRFWHGTGNRKRQRLMEMFPLPCQDLHFHQSMSFSFSCPMPKPTFPSVSVVFCFLSHAKTYISISLCRFWKCRFWHGTGNRKRQRLMEM